MKKLLSLGLAWWALSSSYAQTGMHHHNGVPCLYDHAIEQYAPAYRGAVQSAFDRAQRLGQQHAHSRNTLTIPVVVHVVWRQNAENIADSLIQQQIDILNEDFQRLNPDTARLRAIFRGVAGNPQFQFRLDTVIRKRSDTLFYSSGLFPDVTVADKVKQDCRGGDDAWDVENHLNLWICNMGNSGLLGFAYPPADLPNWPADSDAPSRGLEGVVLDYRVIGRRGVYSVTQFGQTTTIQTRGRSATHEVGHYFGLRHIWGDGSGAIFGQPDCSATDGVNDTPTQGLGSNFECDTTQNTCGSGTTGDLPDMIENYMDYASDSCMNTFTQGQVTIMRGVVAPTGARYKLTLNANPFNPPANDKQAQAEAVSVNIGNNCTLFADGTTLDANPSYIAGCSGTLFDYDVWYQFVAPNDSVRMELSNKSAATGSSTQTAYELFRGSCRTRQSIACGTGDITTFTGLTAGNTYFLRVMSADSLSRQNFRLCLSATANEVGVSQNQLPAYFAQLYPNPSSGVFSLELAPIAQLEGQLLVRNGLGQQVGQALSLDQSAQVIRLDLSSQPAGLYFVEIQTNDGKRWSGKVLVER